MAVEKLYCLFVVIHMVLHRFFHIYTMWMWKTYCMVDSKMKHVKNK